ncbi:MAG TPA: AzlC family ABC transporter permease [Candidatus Binatia bacterium]|nr:AzlC family ABC transporter permease [Candidatus Binatia bacterium]
MSRRSAHRSPGVVRSIVATTLPAAAAILVFGSLYGAAARPLLGVPLTIASSLLIFSGALQFALIGLLGAAAGASALLLTAATLNLRHLVLGAVLRSRLAGSGRRRGALAFFLVDETFGFAIAAGDAAERAGRSGEREIERTLLVSGALCYVAWQLGTLIGLLGAEIPAVGEAAGVIFPVLFIGLAALACRMPSDVARALGAVALTAALAVTLPDLRALAPVVAGVLVALPGRAA